MEKKSKLTPEDLEYLSPAELIILEKHLNLGIDYLKKHLSPFELETLLFFESDKKETDEQLNHDKIEVIGNITLLLNSIFTAVFGAWMGLAGFWGASLGSYEIFVLVIFVAFGMGAFIAYHNYMYIKKRTEFAVVKQKLNTIEIAVLQEIYQKRLQEAESLIQDMNSSLVYLAEETPIEKKEVYYSVNDFENGLDEWIEEFKTIWYENLRLYPQIIEAVPTIDEKIEENLLRCFQESNDEVIQRNSNKDYQRHPLVEKLTSRMPRESGRSTSWIRSNWRELLISFIPTVIGSFSSLFVYLGGGPNIAKAFGNEKLYIFLSDPYNKKIEFFLSLLMTGFLAFFFLHINRQLIKRNQQLESNQKNITQIEGKLTVVDVRLHKLKKAHDYVNRLRDIVKILRIGEEANLH